jgi:ABC-type phosphate transport system auxiliary subunit
MAEIMQKLDRLSSLFHSLEQEEKAREELIAGLLTPEVQTKIAEIREEFSQKEKALRENIDALEKEIKTDTLAFGQTVRASGFTVVWSKGRTLWDSKGLQAYAGAHPDVLQYRKEGEPVVSIRRDQEKA